MENVKNKKSLGFIIKEIFIYLLLLLTLIYSAMAVYYSFNVINQQNNQDSVRNVKRSNDVISTYSYGIVAVPILSLQSTGEYGYDYSYDISIKDISSDLLSYYSLYKLLDIDLDSITGNEVKLEYTGIPYDSTMVFDYDPNYGTPVYIRNNNKYVLGLDYNNYLLNNSLDYAYYTSLTIFNFDLVDLVSSYPSLSTRYMNPFMSYRYSMFNNKVTQGYVDFYSYNKNNAMPMMVYNYRYNYGGDLVQQEINNAYNNGVVNGQNNVINNPNNYDLYNQSQYDSNYQNGYMQGQFDSNGDYHDGYNDAIGSISNLVYNDSIFGAYTKFIVSYDSNNYEYNVKNISESLDGYWFLTLPNGGLDLSNLKNDLVLTNSSLLTMTSNYGLLKSGSITWNSNDYNGNSPITQINLLNNNNELLKSFSLNDFVYDNGNDYTLIISDDYFQNCKIQLLINLDYVPLAFQLLFDYDNLSYQSGLNQGLSQGKIDILSNPNNYDLYDKSQYDNNYINGYNQGYNKGVLEGEGLGERGFLVMFNAIMNAPFNILNGLLNFELFGINLFNLISFILTIGIIVFVGALLIKK